MTNPKPTIECKDSMSHNLVVSAGGVVHQTALGQWCIHCECTICGHVFACGEVGLNPEDFRSVTGTVTCD
jgi:hypothetical protein